jgi:hypothetical protein
LCQSEFQRAELDVEGKQSPEKEQRTRVGVAGKERVPMQRYNDVFAVEYVKNN